MSEERVPVSLKSPVFYDPHGRRWRRVRRTYLALGVAVTAAVGIFIASVLANPLLPRLNLRPISSLPRPSDLLPQAIKLPPKNPRELEARKAQELSASAEYAFVALAFAQLGENQIPQAIETYGKLAKISALATTPVPQASVSASTPRS